MKVAFNSILLLLLLSVGCTENAVPTPSATVDPYFAAQGGGEPRGASYWLLWNGCAPDNRAEMAAANGGREAGWIIMDDMLADPGIFVGEQLVASCEEGVRLLRSAAGTDRQGDRPLSILAGQLLAAQLNLAAGAEHCLAVDETVQRAQLLLLTAEYEGVRSTPPPDVAAETQEQAESLTEQLSAYNAGMLCR